MIKTIRILLKFVQPYVSYIKPFVGYILASFLLIGVISLLSLVNPLFQKLIFDKVILGKELNLLLFLLAIQLFVTLMIAILHSFRNYLTIRMDQTVSTQVRMNIINFVLKLPISFYDNRSIGEILQRINDSGVILQIFNNIRDLFLDFIHLFIFSIVLFLWNWKLALLIFLFTPIKIILNRLAAKYNRKLEQPSWELGGVLNSENVDFFNSIKAMKVYTMENTFAKRMRYFLLSSNELGIFSKMTNNFLSIGISFFGEILGVISTFVGISEVINGNLTVGAYIAFFSLANYVTTPLNNITEKIGNFENYLNPINRINSILNINVELKKEHTTGKDPDNDLVVETIEYRGLRFEYEKDQPILNGINLTANRNDVIAFVGPSGVGKTTLVNLFLKFYDPTEGNIYINNKPITDWDVYTLRSKIGMVMQTPFVFTGTLRENITLRRGHFTDKEIIAALEKANLIEFYKNLKDGLNAVIGESGIALSGGERQRLSIARVFLFNFPILIFDEPTSALDVQSEKIIQQSLLELYPGRITFIIAHRLTTIKNATKIYYIDKGVVIESGTHDELLTLKGEYYSYYQLASF